METPLRGCRSLPEGTEALHTCRRCARGAGPESREAAPAQGEGQAGAREPFSSGSGVGTERPGPVLKTWTAGAGLLGVGGLPHSVPAQPLPLTRLGPGLAYTELVRAVSRAFFQAGLVSSAFTSHCRVSAALARWTLGPKCLQ